MNAIEAFASYDTVRESTSCPFVPNPVRNWALDGRFRRTQDSPYLLESGCVLRRLMLWITA